MSFSSLKPIINIATGKPLMAVYEINLTCNSQCGYCDLPLNQGRRELSREQIQAMFEHLYAEGLRYVFLQGGEPTLRKDLPDVMSDLKELGFDITLITNGTRITAELIESLEQVRASISISLDTLHKERYRRIRGADQLGLVLRGIERLRDYSQPKYITCIVSEINRDDVLDVVRFSREQGFIPVVGAYHWDIERYGKVDNELQYQKQMAASVFQKVLNSELVPSGYFNNYLKDNIDWLNDRPLHACDAGRYSIAIDASGNVAPCLALKHAGNLLESNLTDILNKFDRQAIKRCSDNSSCNMMCSRVVGSNLRNPIAAIRTPDRIPAGL
ncbi:MAG: radical SAM protein [Gammaproteobacteria bacterium]|nr:radical SAM protein [Gammaproteobacteria bacterium]